MKNKIHKKSIKRHRKTKDSFDPSTIMRKHKKAKVTNQTRKQARRDFFSLSFPFLSISFSFSFSFFFHSFSFLSFLTEKEIDGWICFPLLFDPLSSDSTSQPPCIPPPYAWGKSTKHNSSFDWLIKLPNPLVFPHRCLGEKHRNKNTIDLPRFFEKEKDLTNQSVIQLANPLVFPHPMLGGKAQSTKHKEEFFLYTPYISI